MLRSITGQVRIDYGPTSVIMNAAMTEMHLLDHVKLEFRKIAIPPPPVPGVTPPAIPGMPGAPPIPTTPAMIVKDLGIKIVAGIEVIGKQYTLPPLTPPKPPAVPGMPGAPALPAPPAVPLIAEAWISTKLQMPVLSRVTGSFGQQMCHCKNAVPGEPPPTAFQIPANYKQAGLPAAPAPPAPPAPPAMPAAPAPPAAPAIPGMPVAPKPPTFKF